MIHFAHSWDDETVCGQPVLSGVTITTDSSQATCPACAAAAGSGLSWSGNAGTGCGAHPDSILRRRHR